MTNHCHEPCGTLRKSRLRGCCKLAEDFDCFRGSSVLLCASLTHTAKGGKALAFEKQCDKGAQGSPSLFAAPTAARITTLKTVVCQNSIHQL